MIHYLYKITNEENGKVYIGVTKNIKARFTAHLNGYGSKELAKDLPGNFKCEILEKGVEKYIYNIHYLIFT